MTDKKALQQPTTILFGGGGARGAALLGAIEGLDTSRVTTYGGLSIGAVIALLLTCGYDADEIRQTFIAMDGKQIRALSPLNLPYAFGLDRGFKYVEKFGELLAQKGFSPFITFLQLHELTGKILIVQATNLSKRKRVLYSHATDPDMSVVEAIRRSISLPIIFAPVKDELGDLYVDGAIAGGIPIDMFSPEDTLGIILTTAEQHGEINNLIQYVTGIAAMMWNQCAEVVPEGSNIIAIKTKSWYQSDSVLFGTTDEINSLFEQGKVALREWQNA